MSRLTVFVLAGVVFLVGFSMGTAGDLQPFTPLSMEDNKETDTSPEEITEMMVPVCKLFFDAYPSFKDISGAFSPDGRYFAVSNATSSSMTTTNLFDLKTGKNIKRFNGLFSHNTISPVAFSPDSRRLAFVSGEPGQLITLPNKNYIVVWDIPGEKKVCLIPVENTRSDAIIYSLRFSSDGKKLFGVINNTGMIWNIEAQGAVVKTFSRDTSSDHPFDAFHCYPDLSYAVFSDTKTGKNCLRNLVTNKDVEQVFNYVSGLGLSWENRPRMVFSDDGQLFALETPNWGRGSRLLVWDAATGSDICTVPLDYKLTAFTFLPGSHTLVTASDPNPEIPHTQSDEQQTSQATPMRKPVAKTETKAILEFWDIDNLIWYVEKTNLFPRKIKTAYLEGEDDIHYMVASQDGKLLYMRSGKNIVLSGSILSIANGYIFSLDPDHKPDLPAEIRLDDGVIVQFSGN